MSNNQLLSLKEIQLLLKDKRLYIVSKATGLSFPTLKKMADGKEENFTIKTIKSISDYFKK